MRKICFKHSTFIIDWYFLKCRVDVVYFTVIFLFYEYNRVIQSTSLAAVLDFKNDLSNILKQIITEP